MKVVMYHYIRPLKSSMIKGLKALDSEIFYKQLKFLNTEFDIINHYDLYNYFTKDINLPPKPLLLTFDDGYLDVFRYVFPALQANNLKGSFYVPDYFNNRTLLDVNAIHLLLTKHEFIVFYLQYIKKYYNDNISKRNFQDYTCSINTNSRFDTKEVVLFKKLLQYILPEFHRKQIILNLLTKYFDYDMETLFEDFYCSKAQLNTMIKCGMHIGGHGVKHNWLGELSIVDQKIEIEGSHKFLISLNEQPFYSFCYPYGSYNSTTIEILKEFSFEYSFTTRVDDYSMNKNTKFEIPRFDTNDFPLIY